MPEYTSTLSLPFAATIRSIFLEIINEIDPLAKVYIDEPIQGNDKGNGNWWQINWLEIGTPGFDNNETLATIDLTYFRNDQKFDRFLTDTDKFNQITGWVQNAAKVTFNIIDIASDPSDPPAIGKGRILIEPGQGGWVKMNDPQNPKNICWTRNMRFAYGQNFNV